MLYFTARISDTVNITVDATGRFLLRHRHHGFKTGKASGKVTGGARRRLQGGRRNKATAVSNVREAFTITYRT